MKVLKVVASEKELFRSNINQASSISNTNQALPKALQEVGVQDPIGKEVDPSLVFKDSKGELRSLGSYFYSKFKKPFLLSIIYYECPSLCNLHVKALLAGLVNLNLTVGRDFDVIFVSMDEREGPALAFEKKKTLLESYNRKDAEKGFHLLTGDGKNIKHLSYDLNFKFKWIEDQEVFSHASVTYVLTPEGKVSRVLSGLDSSAQNIKFSLLEASQGKVGSFLDKILLYCYRFDPKAGKYTLYAYNVMKLGGGLTVFLLAGFLIFSFFYQDRKIREKKIS